MCDWREVLKKYIKVVLDNEGVHFANVVRGRMTEDEAMAFHEVIADLVDEGECTL